MNNCSLKSLFSKFCALFFLKWDMFGSKYSCETQDMSFFIQFLLFESLAFVILFTSLQNWDNLKGKKKPLFKKRYLQFHKVCWHHSLPWIFNHHHQDRRLEEKNQVVIFGNSRCGKEGVDTLCKRIWHVVWQVPSAVPMLPGVPNVL